MAPPPCSPPSISLKARSSGAACSATGIRNSSASQCRRTRSAGRQGGPRGTRQLRHPQAPQGESLAAAAWVPVKEVGMAWRSAVGIELDEAERCELEARTRRRKISRADAVRAAIVLLAADGRTNLAIPKQLGVT